MCDIMITKRPHNKPAIATPYVEIKKDGYKQTIIDIITNINVTIKAVEVMYLKKGNFLSKYTENVVEINKINNNHKL